MSIFKPIYVLAVVRSYTDAGPYNLVIYPDYMLLTLRVLTDYTQAT